MRGPAAGSAAAPPPRCSPSLAVAATGAPAAADVLISNVGQQASGNLTVQTGGSSPHARYATSFTTAIGATITKITLYVFSASSTVIPRLRLRADSSGSPGSVLHTFTKPASVTERTGTGTVPGPAAYTSTGYVLAADTTYWLEVDRDGALMTASYGATSNNTEDSGGQAGWSIGNGHVYQNQRVTTWTSGNTSLRLKLEGTPAAATAPGAPTALTATADGPTRIDLSWTAPASDGGAAIEGYQVEVSTDGGSDYSILVANTASTATAYSHTGLPGATTRHYRVSAINSAGTGTASDAADATTAAATAPGAPTALTAAANGPDRIDLFWSAPASDGGAAIAGYRIEVSTDGGSNYADLAADTGSAVTSYSHTRLAAGSTRHYRVSAINSAGTGSASNAANATTGATTVAHAPTGLVAAADGPTRIDLSWTAPARDGGAAITGYQIEVSSDGGSNYTNLAADTGNAVTSYSHAGLAASSTRHYRVSAINAAGTSGASNVANATTDAATAPDAPTGLVAAADGPTKIDLSWTAPASDGGVAITGYRIEVSSDGGNSYTNLVADTGDAGTSHRHTGLAGATTRHYRVSAINASGTGSASGVASATTDAATVPGMPTSLVATANGPNRIDLSWTAPANDGGAAVAGYRIEVSADGGGSYSDRVADTNSTATSYSHTGLVESSTRHYRVSAINPVGTGLASAVANATTAAATAPGAPTGLTAAADGPTRIDLSWTAPANDNGSPVTGYKIEVSTDGGSNFVDLVADTGGTATTYTHTGLRGAATRHYRVSAINAIGTSTVSAVANASTAAATAPDAPTALTATLNGLTQIDLSWSAPARDNGAAISGYRIEVSTDGGNAYNDVATNTGSPDTTYSDTGLARGSTRHYRVSAINAAGTGSASNVANAATPAATAPDAPIGVVAAANGPTRIDLYWTAPADDGGAAVSGYRIEVSTDGGGNFSVLVADTGGATTHSHTGLPASATRHYRVSAINAVGTGTASSVAHATTAPSTVPDAPTGLTATANGPTRIDLSWTAPAADNGSAVTGYRIEVSTDGGGRFTDVVADTGSTATTYSHTGLAGSATRHYRVSAVNATGTGTSSGVAHATTATATAPDAPTGLTAAANGPTRIELSWTAPARDNGAAIAGYRIEVSADGGDSFVERVADTEDTATTYLHTGLAGGTTRHYRVSAINAAGTGPASNVADATTAAAAAPDAPTGLTAAASGPTRIELSWTAPASDNGATIAGYRIEVSADGGDSFGALVANTRSRDTSYSHAGLAGSTTRHYRVSAINAAGTSPASNVAHATTAPVTVPSAPTGLTARANGPRRIGLFWTAPASDGGVAIIGLPDRGLQRPRAQLQRPGGGHREPGHDLLPCRARGGFDAPLPGVGHQHGRYRPGLQRRARHHGGVAGRAREGVDRALRAQPGGAGAGGGGRPAAGDAERRGGGAAGRRERRLPAAARRRGRGGRGRRSGTARPVARGDAARAADRLLVLGDGGGGTAGPGLVLGRGRAVALRRARGRAGARRRGSDRHARGRLDAGLRGRLLERRSDRLAQPGRGRLVLVARRRRPGACRAGRQGRGGADRAVPLDAAHPVRPGGCLGRGRRRAGRAHAGAEAARRRPRGARRSRLPDGGGRSARDRRRAPLGAGDGRRLRGRAHADRGDRRHGGADRRRAGQGRRRRQYRDRAGDGEPGAARRGGEPAGRAGLRIAARGRRGRVRSHAEPGAGRPA